MKALIILEIILLILVLLSFLRLGGRAVYAGDGFRADLKVGPLLFRLYPREVKGKSSKHKKKKHPDEESAPDRCGSLELFRQFLPLLLEAVGEFRRKVRIDHIDLELTVAAGDPAAAAIAYGSANALLGMIWPLIENNFNVKDRSLRTGVDFHSDTPVIRADALFTLTLAQLVRIGLRFGPRAWKQYRTIKKAQCADRKADPYGKKPSHS